MKRLNTNVEPANVVDLAKQEHPRRFSPMDYSEAIVILRKKKLTYTEISVWFAEKFGMQIDPQQVAKVYHSAKR